MRATPRYSILEAGGINLYGFVGNEPVSRLDFFGLSACSDFVNSLVQDFEDHERPNSRGRTWLKKRNETLKNTDGFKEKYVSGGQGGAVSRHMYAHAGVILNNQSAFGKSPIGNAASYIKHAEDWAQRYLPNRTKEESDAEMAGNRAARKLAERVRDAYRERAQEGIVDRLREQLLKLLCD